MIEVWMASTFLAIMNNNAINTMCKSFCEYMSSFILGTYLDMKLLYYVVNLCLTF